MEQEFHCREHVRVKHALVTRGKHIPENWTGEVVRIWDDGLGRRFLDVVWDMDATQTPVKPEEIEPL